MGYGLGAGGGDSGLEWPPANKPQPNEWGLGPPAPAPPPMPSQIGWEGGGWTPPAGQEQGYEQFASIPNWAENRYVPPPTEAGYGAYGGNQAPTPYNWQPPAEQPPPPGLSFLEELARRVNAYQEANPQLFIGKQPFIPGFEGNYSPRIEVPYGTPAEWGVPQRRMSPYFLENQNYNVAPYGTPPTTPAFTAKDVEETWHMPTQRPYDYGPGVMPTLRFAPRGPQTIAPAEVSRIAGLYGMPPNAPWVTGIRVQTEPNLGNSGYYAPNQSRLGIGPASQELLYHELAHAYTDQPAGRFEEWTTAFPMALAQAAAQTYSGGPWNEWQTNFLNPYLRQLDRNLRAPAPGSDPWWANWAETWEALSPWAEQLPPVLQPFYTGLFAAPPQVQRFQIPHNKFRPVSLRPQAEFQG